MKAIVKTKAAYGGLAVMDYPDPPSPTEDQIVIEVKSSAVCGTDLHTYEFVPAYHSMKIPVIMGHEFSGIVKEVGPLVQNFKPGDRVIGESAVSCGKCPNCINGKTNLCDHGKMRGVMTDGAMCGLVTCSERAVHHIADSISFDAAAVSQPLAISVAGVLDNCRIHHGDDVVIFGPGIIGQTAAQLARLQGAKHVILVGTDLDAATRLPLAESMGFLTVNCQQTPVEEVLPKMTGRSTVDVAIECAGAKPSLDSCIKLLKKDGWLSILGVFGQPTEVDLYMMLKKALNVRFTFSCCYRHYETALQLLETKQVELVKLSTVYDYSDAQKAYDDALAKICLKPVLRF